MPAPRKRQMTAAPRRRATVNRGMMRSANRSFFMIMIILLVFALLYTFGGHWFFPESAPRLPEENEIFVHFIDVGQGDATLIQSRDHTVLIDGGEPRYGTRVLNYLRDAGVTRLDYVVATHPHSDHIGGLIDVLGQMEVGYVIMPDATNNTVVFEHFAAAIINHNHSARFVTVGDRLTAGIIDLIVLAPIARETAWTERDNLNDASVVLHMTHGDTSFLFAADAERASEAAMLAGGKNLRATVLHVGHHGSNTSTTQPFLDAVSPVAAVISSGEGNRHGHPHREVLERLTASGVRILRNDELGHILLTTDGTEVILW